MVDSEFPSRDPFSNVAHRGNQSVEKGVKFEMMVAELFRLLGARVLQNIEICQKKVDMLVVFGVPGSTAMHRVLVECKDEKHTRAQNQRVMEFAGLLGTARKANEADSATIITRNHWSDQAKGFAQQSGIELITYDQKLAQLIDFTEYLRILVDRFEKTNFERPGEAPLAQYYVDLEAQSSTGKGPLDKYVHNWLDQRDTQKQLAVLGEYGTGKTAYCYKLAHDLASSWLAQPCSGRIPILLNLRDFIKTLRIEAVVTSFLDEQCGVLNPRYRLFNLMNEAGLFLIILDGFDEMAVKVDADTLDFNLHEIEKLAAPVKSKVIITSRTEYFISTAEEISSLSPMTELLPIRNITYDTLKILLWGERQISEFLKKRVPLITETKQDWIYYYNIITKIPGFSDLSIRPVLLEMVVKTLPQLIAEKKPINRPNLYTAYLKQELKRQKITQRRQLLIDHDTRFSLLEGLASGFYTGTFNEMTFADAVKEIRRHISLPNQELEAYTRDFLTCSFLVRQGDEYRFSHRSIMEFLVATVLNREISQGVANVLNRKSIDPVVMKFLLELHPTTNQLWEMLEIERKEHDKGVNWLAGNVVTLLSLIDPESLAGKNLSSLIIRDASLSNADLRGANLADSTMINTNIVGARFLKEDLLPVKLQDVTIHVLCLLKKNESATAIQGALYDNLLSALFGGPPNDNAKLVRDYIAGPQPGFAYMLLDLIVRVHDFHGLQTIGVIPHTEQTLMSVGFYDNELLELLTTIPRNIQDHLLVQPNFDNHSGVTPENRST